MQAVFARAHAVTQLVLAPLSRLSLIFSAVCLVFLAVIVLLQVTSRYVGLSIVWGSDIAGYTLVATTFLAMAPTLRHDLHIRVTLVLGRVRNPVRKVLEVWSYTVGLAFTIYAAYWSIIQVMESRQFGDVSIGIIAFPLWIPQMFLGVGFVLFALTMLEGLFAVLAGKPPAANAESGDITGTNG